MKILAFGCLHSDQKQAQKLADKAVRENVDLVVICGDITLGEQSTENLIGPFVKNNKKVILVPGNHESEATADFLAKRYGVVNLHGYGVTYDGVGFFGCGSATIGMHRMHESDIYSTFKIAHDKISSSKKRIMISHVHPSGTLMEKFSEFVIGSTGVRAAIESLKPDIMICSHVHEAAGLEEMIGNTLLFNVGREGKIIDV